MGNPFKGNPIKRFGKFIKRDVIRPIGRLGGNDKYGNYSAWGMAPSEDSANIEAGKAQAAAEEAAKQAEFEATRKAGLERLAQKKKKGFGASVIVNPSLGSTTTLGS